MKNRKKGFTLIELLVVIAIIALLLSIIMPALGKAKMYAQEIVCKSGIRQYGIATMIYTNDNDDKIPDPWLSLYDSCQGRCPGVCQVGGHQTFQGETQRYCRWHNPNFSLERFPQYAGPYWPYLSVTQAHVCPVFERVAISYDRQHMEGNGNWTAAACIGGTFEVQYSYSMNSLFRRTVNGNVVSVRKSQVTSPSQTFLWAEENMWTLTGFSTFVLNDTALATGPDSIGSFHRASQGQLSVQQRERRYTGEGAANVLMVDGSVTWGTPEDTVLYRGRVR